MKRHGTILALLCLAVASALLLAPVGCEKPEAPASPKDGSGSAKPGPDPATSSGEEPAPASSGEKADVEAPPLTVNIDIEAGPKKIVLEAESGEVVEPMKVFEDETASGGKFVMTPEPPDNDHQALGGETRLIVKVPAARKYNIWLRVYWNHECDNSFDVSIAGGEKIAVTNNTYTHWQWLQVTREAFDLEAGALPIIVTSREDDSKLDQVLLVEAKGDPKQDYVPAGIEKSN